MSSDSRNERERLKEEYKEHYRKMREVKERLIGIEKQKKISDALNDMDPTPLMNTLEGFLQKVKSKVANVEARLDIAMDSLISAGDDFEEIQQRDEELRKEKAKETLRQAKIEMGVLYSEIERQAEAVEAEKTIGTGKITEEDKADEVTKEKSTRKR